MTSDDLAGENLILVLESPPLDRIDFDIAHDDQIVWREMVGDTVTFDEITLPYRTTMLTFDLAQEDQETRIYFRIKSQIGIEVQLQIASAETLINDLLELAQLESDSFEPECELMEMSRFLNEVKEMIPPSAMEKELVISTDFASANLLV